MTDIGRIIQSVLDNEDALHDVERSAEIAEKCEQKLLIASLEQAASILGGSVEIDNDGQAIIYTGVYREPFSQHQNV
jgi:hypothetical protein